jgi:Xaa-Pro aminopeptidase
MDSYHQERLHRLQGRLAPNGVDLLLLEDPLDLYYLTGCELSTGILLVDEQGASLVVDGRYITACQQALPCPVYLLEEAQLKALLVRSDGAAIGIDADRMTIARHAYFQNLLGANAALVPIASPVSPLRAIKDSLELDLLRAAAQLGSAGYDHVVQVLRTGCTEEEVATSLEIFWKQNGAQGLAFAPIIAFGAHSALPHYRAGQGRLQADDCALIDIGVQRAFYHSDMTRVRFLGHPSAELQKIYAIVAEAQAAALALCRPGSLAGDLDKAARHVIQSHGYGAYFNHNLGHGVGLAVHEAPRISSQPAHAAIPLAVNMVITIEPGIYLPGIGGVRLENTVIVTANGYEDLTLRPL